MKKKQLEKRQNELINRARYLGKLAKKVVRDLEQSEPNSPQQLLAMTRISEIFNEFTEVSDQIVEVGLKLDPDNKPLHASINRLRCEASGEKYLKLVK